MVTRCVAYYDINCLPQVVSVTKPTVEEAEQCFSDAYRAALAGETPPHEDQASCGPPLVCNQQTPN